MLEVNQVYHQSCIAGMHEMDEESVDMVCTSPPYDDLRTYNDSSTWDFNVFTQVAQELTRVLKPGGVIMWNVGDAVVKGSETGSSFRQALYFKDECGLSLHDTMIYEKTGIPFTAGPKSNRYSQAFEYCFVLSKGAPKTVNIIMDKKNKYAGTKSWGNAQSRVREGGIERSNKKTKTIREFGARTNIWKVMNSGGYGQSDKRAYDHPATMPESLALDHIKTWSNEGDVILDPFMGSGTTARMAVDCNRQYIGFEMDEAYYKLSLELIDDYKCKNKPLSVLEISD